MLGWLTLLGPIALPLKAVVPVVPHLEPLSPCADARAHSAERRVERVLEDAQVSDGQFSWRQAASLSSGI